MPRKLLFVFVVSVVIVAIARVTCPSDLYDQHQPRTIAYTADMVVNGHWILPVDAAGVPATKPPLYNWIGALAVVATGSWSEWVLRLPSVLAAAVTLLITMVAAGWMCPEPLHDGIPADERKQRVRVVMLFAGAAWVTCYPVMKLAYLARPDMVLAACMSASWALATIALRPECQRRWAWSLAFWLCVGLAALAKGPPALAGVLYALLAAKLIHGRWSAFNRLYWWWGLPLALAIGLSWLYLAYRINPVHVNEVLLGKELAKRVTRDGPLGPLLKVYQMPLHFIVRFLPWTVPFVFALIAVPWRKWASHTIAPGLLWVFTLLLFFTLGSGGRADFLAPAYGPAAGVAAAGALMMIERWRPMRVALSLIPLITAGILGWYVSDLTPAAREKVGTHSQEFINQVRPIVGEQHIRFTGAQTEMVRTLLRRAYPVDRSLDDNAAWEIRPIAAGEAPLVQSGEIRDGAGSTPAKLGLFRLARP